MTIEELRDHLLRLIGTYVASSAAQEELVSLVNRCDVPVKAVLVGLAPFVSNERLSEMDAQTIRNIAFHFC